MSDDTFWQTKLHARLHDPAEKALVLLRDPAGHEGGTSRALHRLLGFDRAPESGTLAPDRPDALDTVLFTHGIPARMYRTVQRADWWASAADRPQWPMEEVTTSSGRTRKVADWAQVRWTASPTLVHPLSGREFDLGSLADTDFHDIKERSRAHFERLVVRDGAEPDWRRTLFAFWRFGPELREDEDNGKLGELWSLLPADTRVPDHSIWDHLDLTSAFAGAFAADADEDAALLALSIGPVQSFIAAARTTSDLWAGSHLLARLAWEAIKVVCERLGPDAVLFPRLRGIPQVDVWLRDECELPAEWFDQCEWTRRGTDSNPLFSAALPNRLVAIVPASGAREIAEVIEARVRDWLQSRGGRVVDGLLEAAGFRDPNDARDESVHAYRQMRDQIDGFPEVHWACVPFSLVRPRDAGRQTDLDTSALSVAMAPFFGVASSAPSGFLDSQAWKVLQKDRQWSDNTTFFAPNPGVLYPAVYDLAERVLAAAKTVRPFEQMTQRGWRCSLTGETEWLTTDAAQLEMSYRRQDETLWARVADKKRSWAKAGEHLGALPAIKRLWPDLFAREVARIVDPASGDSAPAATEGVDRFVVSTHTMALAHQIEARLDSERSGTPIPGDLRAELDEMVADLGARPVALPRKLMHLIRHDRDALHWAKRLPGLMDAAAENAANDDDDEGRQRDAEKLIKRLLGVERIETYYALLLMDGDHMGRILSGEDPECTIPYLDSFHPKVRRGFESRANDNAALTEYSQQKRAMSPNRHLAISGALNDFALHVVPEIVEGEFLGRVMYAGGDDVMAMLPAADLLPAMRRLRDAYRGSAPDAAPVDWQAVRRHRGLVFKDGFACLRGRVMRMMGERATASCGAVIAHHMAPLAAVMRELRAAEKRAKTEGGRDAFSVTVVKRSGGVLRFTAKWGEPLALLLDMRAFLADPSVSRRAVYNSLVWLKDLPEDAGPEMLGSLLGFQFARQTAKAEARRRHDLPGLGRRIAALAGAPHEISRSESTQPGSVPPTGKRREWLERFLGVAEFLARETRLDSAEAAGGDPAEPANVHAAGRG